MRNPNALTPADRAYLCALGAIRETKPSGSVCQPSKAQWSRNLAKQREWRERKRGGRPAMTNAESGALGGKPLELFTPAILRNAWRRIKVKGERHYIVARALGVADATLAYHIGRPSTQPSRAMYRALKEKIAA
jgi:hypothetical protein